MLHNISSHIFHTSASLGAKCNVSKSRVMMELLQGGGRGVVTTHWRRGEWANFYVSLFRAPETEADFGPASPSGWMEAHSHAREPNTQTYHRGWRDAPGAGLAVTEPEATVVPGNRRVELQLMPLFLEARRTRKDFHWPYSQLLLLLFLL